MLQTTRVAGVLVVLLLAFGCGGPGKSASGGGGSGSGGAGGSSGALPAGWSGGDIGAVGHPGTSSYSGGTFTLSASGQDIWDNADMFHFAWQALNGDATITARVASLDNTDAWAKSGVMIRESLNADSRFAMTVVTPSNGVTLQYRSQTGQGCNLQWVAGLAAPAWVRLSRSGDTFTGSASSDGVTWTAGVSTTLSMGATVYIGLCVTAHNNALQAWSTIDSVAISTSSAPPPTPTGSVSIATPVSRIVYQRNNANQAPVPLRGGCSGNVTRVEARALVVNGGSSTGWTVVDGAPSGGSWRGSLTLNGGWYGLEVRAFEGGAQVASASLDRVGVGEIFIVAGHSVAQGQDIQIEGSTDERGITIPDNRTADQHTQYNNTADPAWLPPAVFAQYASGVTPAPFGAGTYFWGKFAQYVAQNQNVPVIVYNAAFGGTSLEHWSKSSQGIWFPHSFVNASIRMPYINVYNTLKQYIRLTGMRAILSDQGANDWPNTDLNQVYGYYKTWVDQSRADLGFGQLAVVVNRHTPNGNGVIRQAQMKMINEAGSCFTGPDYDTLAPEDRHDGIHLSAQGEWKTASMWAAALDGGFFASSQPYLPTFP